MRRTLPLGLLLILSGLVVACDTGDGREMKVPSVPYVAPTDPPSTSAP